MTVEQVIATVCGAAHARGDAPLRCDKKALRRC